MPGVCFLRQAVGVVLDGEDDHDELEQDAVQQHDDEEQKAAEYQPADASPEATREAAEDRCEPGKTTANTMITMNATLMTTGVTNFVNVRSKMSDIGLNFLLHGSLLGMGRRLRHRREGR